MNLSASLLAFLVLYTTVRALPPAVAWDYTGVGAFIASPTVHGGRVYCGNMDGRLQVFDAASGAVLWNFPTGAGIKSSALVWNERVYFGSGDGALYCVDINPASPTYTTELWRFTAGQVKSSPAEYDGSIFAGCNNFTFVSLNGLTGALNWSITTGDINKSSPVVRDGVVFFGSNDHYIRAVWCATEAGHTGGTPKWSFLTGGEVISSPYATATHLYCGSSDGFLYKLDIATGALVWAWDSGLPVISSPALADGVVYVGSDDMELHAISDATGLELWSSPTGGQVGSSPVVADGVVYFGSRDDKLYAVNTTTHAEEWAFTAAGDIVATPALSGGKLYIGDLGMKLHALDLSGGSPPLETAFSAVADAFTMESQPTCNSGTQTALGVRQKPGNNVKSWLKFQVAGLSGSVVSARLRLTAATAIPDATLSAVADNSWTETGITWATQPAAGAALATQSSIAAAETREFDVTSHVTADGTYAFALKTSSDLAGLQWRSRETADAAQRPQLIVTTSGAPPGGGGLFIEERFGYQLLPGEVIFKANASVAGGTRDLKMRVYQPTGAGVPALRPALVGCPGGSFSGQYFNEDACILWAKRGYTVFSLAPRSRNLDSPPAASELSAAFLADLEAGITRIGFPGPVMVNAASAQFVDVMAALGYIRDHAAEYGVDPGRIAMSGTSSGNVTMTNALYCADECGFGVLPADAGISHSGAMAPPAATYLQPGDVALLLVHGTADGTVPIAESESLFAALQSAAVPAEFYPLSGVGHDSISEITNPAHAVGGELITTKEARFLHTHLQLSTLGTVLRSGFTGWMTAQGLPATQQAQWLDPDGDGADNLLEYALGGHPAQPSTQWLPVSTLTGPGFTLTFQRIPGRSDITITLQSSDTLTGPWTGIARSTTGGAFTALVAGVSVSEMPAPGGITVHVTDAVAPADPSVHRRFYRLLVGQP